MRKQLSLFVWAVAMFGMMPVMAATNTGASGASSADLTNPPATRTRASVNYEKYETRSTTRTYAAKDGTGVYYTQPQNRSAIYSGSAASSQNTMQTTRAETARAEAKRKYYLAHPFFQPLQGRFGSVTDLAYTSNSYDIKLTPLPGFVLSDNSAKWDMSQWAVKEDLSYGITDKLAVVGMIRYQNSQYTMKWSDPATPNDSMRDSGIDLYGLGLQWRVYDSADWIATLSGYYQYQKDIANMGILDLKAGYKVGTSTIYGLARGWWVGFKGNSYGNGVTDGTETLFIAYKTDVSNAYYLEGGVGVFTVLDEDWTLNLEAVVGNYDWHNQATLKGAIGWQPGESFALNLYGKAAVWDSAEGKDLGFWWSDPVTTGGAFQQLGTAHLSNYSEWTVGLQAILYF